MGLIYHIAYRRDWSAAQGVGEYTMSTRGMTLTDQGFIHASTAAQVAATANRFYAGEPDLIVLAIEEALLEPKVKYEPAPGTNELFPHLYGPLNTTAVTGTCPLHTDAEGRFTFSADQ